MKLLYSLKSRQDLRDIYGYIAYTLLSPQTARSLTDSILQAAGTLKSMPERNPLYKEEPWHSLGVRFLPVKNYTVFYTVDREADTVFVVRILYGGRDISRQLKEE